MSPCILHNILIIQYRKFGIVTEMVHMPLVFRFVFLIHFIHGLLSEYGVIIFIIIVLVMQCITGLVYCYICDEALLIILDLVIGDDMTSVFFFIWYRERVIFGMIPVKIDSSKKLLEYVIVLFIGSY